MDEAHAVEATVEAVKEAVGIVAADRYLYAMSEADVELCVSTLLREAGFSVIEQLPVLPSWRTPAGRTVHLHARRADLSVRAEGCTTPVLVELKLGRTTVDDAHRSQAKAYAVSTGVPCLLAQIEKGVASRTHYLLFDASHSVATSI